MRGLPRTIVGVSRLGIVSRATRSTIIVAMFAMVADYFPAPDTQVGDVSHATPALPHAPCALVFLLISAGPSAVLIGACDVMPCPAC